MNTVMVAVEKRGGGWSTLTHKVVVGPIGMSTILNRCLLVAGRCCFVCCSVLQRKKFLPHQPKRSQLGKLKHRKHAHKKHSTHSVIEHAHNTSEKCCSAVCLKHPDGKQASTTSWPRDTICDRVGPNGLSTLWAVSDWMLALLIVTFCDVPPRLTSSSTCFWPP